MPEKEAYTTGQVARMCGVSETTVKKWCSLGKLKFYRVPYGEARRIARAEVEAFMQLHGIETKGGAA